MSVLTILGIRESLERHKLDFRDAELEKLADEEAVIRLNGYLMLEYRHNTANLPFVSYSRQIASLDSTALIAKMLPNQMAAALANSTLAELPIDVTPPQQGKA